MLSENIKMPHLTTLGLSHNPFPVVPDSHNYFTTEEMYSEISDILHCIDARKGFILISGEVGLGKTTLSRLLLQKLELKKINTSLVLNTFLQSGSLLKAINSDFNIHIDSEEISDQLDALNSFLIDQYGKDKNCVIVIDDAQQLNFESLELIRQLSNLETNQNKLVQIILVAQSEILDTLNRNDLRQLKSRIALNLKINPLTLSELGQYIDFRLARAGSNGRITLEINALKLLHKLSKGHPRIINLVMDRCMYVVAASGNNRINKNLIAKAYDEISLTKQETSNYKWLAMASVLLVTVGVFGYQFIDLILSDINQPKYNSTNKSIEDVNLIDLADIKQKITVPKLIESSNKITTKSNVDEIVFLNQFGLGSLNNEFIKAVKNNDFEQFKMNLQRNYGFNLLLSDKEIVSDNNKKIWVFKANNNNKWLTFWKPGLRLDAFYQGYYSESIEQLQINLQNEGFYRSIVDGVVGEKTIIAIAKFQSTVGINASGFPDEITLYQLQKLIQSSLNIGTELHQINEQKKSKNSNKKMKIKPAYSLANNSITTD